MRMVKKIMTGMSVAAVALAVAGGVNAADAGAFVLDPSTGASKPTTSQAPGGSGNTSTGKAGKTTVEIDAAHQQMKVTASSTNAKEVYVSYDAIKADKSGNLTVNAKAKWDIYPVKNQEYTGSVIVKKTDSIDLSALKVTKDVYVTVKDELSDKMSVYKLEADAHKVSGKYEVAGGASKLTFKNGKNAFDPAAEGVTEKLEYRTEKNDGWNIYDAAAFDMSVYEKQSATLYFRFKAADQFTFEDKTAEEDAKFYYYEATGYFASAEAKVKVKKEGNAPSATIDYDKGAFKVKKDKVLVRNILQFTDQTTALNSAYDYDSILGETDAVPTEEQGGYGAFVAPVKDVVTVNLGYDGIFEVITPSDGNKKIASKIGVYFYNKVATPTAETVNLTATAAAAKDKYNITITNTGDCEYVVYTEDPMVNVDAKGTTVKVGKPATIKNVTADATLYVCTASNKKESIFRSLPYKWQEVAEMEGVTAAPTESAAPAESQAP